MHCIFTFFFILNTVNTHYIGYLELDLFTNILSKQEQNVDQQLGADEPQKTLINIIKMVFKAVCRRTTTIS